jgi:hypothetical protein
LPITPQVRKKRQGKATTLLKSFCWLGRLLGNWCGHGGNRGVPSHTSIFLDVTILKNGTNMNKVINTLSRMAVAVPLTVAAPVAFSSDSVSPPTGTQSHWDQQWRLSDRVNAGRRLPPEQTEAFVDILRSAMDKYVEHCP